MAENLQQPSFKDTLNLPRTDFPLRADAQINDPKILQRWQEEDLYTQAFIKNAGRESFILHDGPPYANGNIHIGHAYNKILKDIITKSQRMSGKHVPITPGWDCHGLPIELKVTQEFPHLSREALVKECRLYAAKWIEAQKDSFKRLGVVMNWDKPYLTMSYSYEAAILRAFSLFVERGYIEKKLKTVPWCPSDQTVLATAEIEYKERKDPSIFVAFPLSDTAKKKLLPDLVNADVACAVWTTTPWTLPLNRAVLVKPKTIYDVIAYGDRFIIVAAALSEKLASLLEIPKKVVATLNSDEMEHLMVRHPFIEGFEVPLLLDHNVSLEDGTALVHCAPGCGPIDYEIGVREGLEIFGPVSTDGKYTEGIEPLELIGMPVADGQIWVIKKLVENGRMLYKTTIKHSYPHCWRCRNGLIFRATSQWFCNLSHDNLRDKALDSLQSIEFYPARSVNFLKATIEGRLEWCLSRQRMWGVPIPALICNGCSHAWTNVPLIEVVARGVEKEGIEYWQTVSLKELGITGCERCASTDLKKEQDILDVWFDSGVSHYAVLYGNKELGFPANAYLEGVDQHRGWFQSSLLTSVALEGQASMKSIISCGFVVDAQGHKMSKSLGNVVSPQEVIDALGTDGLRLWAASLDYAGDAVISKTVLDNVGQVLRKIRNTCRFLLSNLYDFDHEKDSLALKDLSFLDQCALVELIHLSDAIRKAYAANDFTAVYHALNEFCTVSMSQIYMDVTKDRLYTDRADSRARRSAQTTIWYILDTLTKLMAPILSFTAESVADHYQRNKKESIHLQDFNDLSLIEAFFKKRLASSDQPLKEFESLWHFVLDIRSALLKIIEAQRAQGVIKHPYEAQLFVHMNFTGSSQALYAMLEHELKANNETLEEFLKELLVVSRVTQISSIGDVAETDLKGLSARAAKAEGVKCPRCWQWHEDVCAHDLCKRCFNAI